MKLSDFFPRESIVRDGSFSYLDEAAAGRPGALVFCQTVPFLRMDATVCQIRDRRRRGNRDGRPVDGERRKAKAACYPWCTWTFMGESGRGKN